MSYDLNDHHQPPMGPIGELIPDGTFAKVRLTIVPGGLDGPEPLDAGLLTASQSSDAKLLRCTCTVVEGPHARKIFRQYFTVVGGTLDMNGQSIGLLKSLGTFRAMTDSAYGLDPTDYSPAAKIKRMLHGLKYLDGLVFAARIMVEPPFKPQYGAANRLANVVLPGEPQYDAIMRGETVPPEPVKAPQRKAESAPRATWQASQPAGDTQPSATTRGSAWGEQAAVPVPQAPVDQAPGAAAADPMRASATGLPTWLNG